jgi:N-acetylneuraminate synthase
VHNKQLLDWIVQTGDPVILSSGLSLTDETRALVHRLRAQGVPLALLHCTTRYPTPPEQVGLNMLEAFHDEFSDVPVGLSDHSGTIYPGVIASYLGASIIEVHLTLHRRMFGPDVSSSLTPEQLAELVIASDAAWRMRRHPVDKAVQLSGLAKERNIFGRSLVAAHPIAEGQLINEAALAFKKPGGGLTYDQRHQLLGKRARRDLPQDQTIGADDVV